MLTTRELERFVRRLANTPESWAQLVRPADDMRVHEQIWDDPDVNAWVICWTDDQDTGFHDHDESAAAIAVVAGQVREDRLRLLGSPAVRTIRAGETFTVAPESIHRVVHSGTRPAVTIHAYSPPLARMGAYRRGTDGELEREALSVTETLRAEPAAA